MYHDLGNLNFSFITQDEGKISRLKLRLSNLELKKRKYLMFSHRDDSTRFSEIREVVSELVECMVNP